MTRQDQDINRRSFLKKAALTGSLVAAGGLGYRSYSRRVGRDFHPERAAAYLSSIAPAAQPATLPNVVLILTDDLGYGDVDAPALTTPNFERMAGEGVRLNHAYSSASVCTPSRAGLLTGRYPIRTHMTNPLYPTGHAMNLLMDVLGRYAYGVTNIPHDEILLPEVLRRRGYRTGMAGKWHLGDQAGHLPHERGFESFYGTLYSNDVLPYAIYRNDEIAIPSPADQNLLTQQMTREAIAFIREHRDEPFFFYLAHPMPHEPMHASDAFRGRSAGGLYGDAAEELDWSVGQILDTLDELDLSSRTLLILTSDNGPWWQGNPGFSRGRKLGTFEGGFRVPFLARWPGTIPAGTRSDGMTMNFDLFATCLGIAGAPLPQDRIVDGQDILPMMAGARESPHDSVYYYDTRTLRAVRYQQWKYHRRSTTENGPYWPLKQGPFLFDVTTDPNESYSLIESMPELAADLEARLDAWDAAIDENVRGWL